VYQPQLELLSHLRRNGFKTFIVSGGSVEFMRPWSERVYGIPPEQVIGSQNAMRFEQQGSQPVLLREPKIDFVDDGPLKPVSTSTSAGARSSHSETPMATGRCCSTRWPARARASR